MADLKPTFSVRHAIALLTPPPEFNQADVDLICERVIERFSQELHNLYLAWLRESETRIAMMEPYAQQIQQLLRLVDHRFTVIGSCRKPFLIHVRLVNFKITFKVTKDYCSWQPMR